MVGVEMLVLELPSSQAHPDVVAALADAVGAGLITILDFAFLAHQEDGQVRIVEAQSDLREHGWGGTPIVGRTLLSAEDLDVVISGMTPGTSAAVLVCEILWSRRLSQALTAIGGQLALHVQVPVTAVTTGRW
jgi:hypothetical protein